MNDLIGGRYRISRRLGQGGMGAVYEANDESTGQRVAVKVVTAEVARNEVLLGRFEREVRAARGLDTPHVVRFLDAGRDPISGLPFLVMEVLEGEDVARIFKRTGPMRPDLAMRIVAQACLGLEVAHAQRIVHRDIKPANLFLARGPGALDRTVKILDFGIAKLAPDASVAGEAGEITGLTRTGSMLGSPLYMSPEQARGHKNIDARADIWSLGVVLYAALAGRTPHQDNDALGDLIIAICTEPAPPVTQLAPWVPREVAALVHRALSLDPAGRFQSAGEMRAAIGALLPGGFAIREDMLVPLPEAERASRPHAIAAHTASTSPSAYTISDEPTARYSGPSLGISTDTPAALQMGPIPSSPPPGPHATTVPSQRSRGGAGLLAAVALVVAAGVGAATFLITGRSSPAPTTAPASNAIEAPPPEPAATAPAPTAAPAPTTAPAIATVPASASALAPGAPGPSAAPLPSGRVPGPMPRPANSPARPAGASDIYLGR
ncbi:serine/threonine-protein kinase [Polyangium aurulentum]|uniref:serine/threonine-protein kinase n=1 Tax=Polyangium aurulentum TaxID=2567896 RepID=UPI0010AE36E3|nr:serine/threonine-protein kinase [Polyangium aurulentum]UQA57658.1 serine/threonine protein kinase [Polyangium aurulentum]